jgi:hypothetical protein
MNDICHTHGSASSEQVCERMASSSESIRLKMRTVQARLDTGKVTLFTGWLLRGVGC